MSIVFRMYRPRVVTRIICQSAKQCSPEQIRCELVNSVGKAFRRARFQVRLPTSNWTVWSWRREFNCFEFGVFQWAHRDRLSFIFIATANMTAPPKLRRDLSLLTPWLRRIAEAERGERNLTFNLGNTFIISREEFVKLSCFDT